MSLYSLRGYSIICHKPPITPSRTRVLCQFYDVRFRSSHIVMFCLTSLFESDDSFFCAWTTFTVCATFSICELMKFDKNPGKVTTTVNYERKTKFRHCDHYFVILFCACCRCHMSPPRDEMLVRICHCLLIIKKNPIRKKISNSLWRMQTIHFILSTSEWRTGILTNIYKVHSFLPTRRGGWAFFG